MALQTAAHAASPAAAAIRSLAQQSVADNSLPGTSHAVPASNALASSQTLSAGLPLAYASHIQSFPMVPPALSVMIPTNTASQSYHNSPNAPQVCSLVAWTSFSSLHAQHVPPTLHLQDVLALRLAQDLAFQQAVQQRLVQAAAKAAVSLLGVRLALQHLFYCSSQNAACTCTCCEHVALQAFYNETPSNSPNYGHFAGREFKEGDRSACIMMKTITLSINFSIQQISQTSAASEDCKHCCVGWLLPAQAAR